MNPKKDFRKLPKNDVGTGAAKGKVQSKDGNTGGSGDTYKFSGSDMTNLTKSLNAQGKGLKRFNGGKNPVAIGSSLGALVLVSLSDYLGLEKILEYYPGLDQSQIWKLTLDFFKKYGIIVAFIAGLTPFSQQPALIIAGLIHNSFIGLAIAIFTSRTIKYLVMAYIASHAPKLLNKMWGLKDELVDSGIKIE